MDIACSDCGSLFPWQSVTRCHMNNGDEVLLCDACMDGLWSHFTIIFDELGEIG